MTQVGCIYKVPSSLRDVKPEAYRPRRVIIGLRDRSVKPDPATDGAETSSKPTGKNNIDKKKYKPMEDKKIEYFKSFTERCGEDAIEEMKKFIKVEEENIRGSYCDTDSSRVSKESFVDHILKDSIFIMEFILNKLGKYPGSSEAKEDNAISNEVKRDLLLLENQLPYFIFENLFGSVVKKLGINETVEQCILKFFDLEITKSTTFMHFTDMFRYVYEESLEQAPLLNDLSGAAIMMMENADKLSRAGVKFKTWDKLSSSEREGLYRESSSQAWSNIIWWCLKQNRAGTASSNQQPLDTISTRSGSDDYSLRVAFNKGCLVMSSFHADEYSDTVLRNVIAYEQCHDGLKPYTSNYMHFINFLITTEEDVEVLRSEGVVTNGMGRPSLVLEMVNQLKSGVDESNSQYHIIANELSVHCNSRRKRTWATLKNVYFNDLWRGTATIAAILIVLLTLIGTVASVIQAVKSFDGKQKTPGGR